MPDAPLTNANELSDTSLMFLVHPTLGDSHIDQTCRALEAVMAEAAGHARPACSRFSLEPLRHGRLLPP